MLYEFMNMLVRIAFWRANPNFGLHGNKDELVPVPFALSSMLNEIILPRAKRENSAAFRNKEIDVSILGPSQYVAYQADANLKKGILEVGDVLAVNKADGSRVNLARAAARDHAAA